MKVTLERRRPNIELKNSEDVQHAHIGDYFKYDDLSRMEAEAISIKIAESESSNYEYVELVLLFFPSYLPTNLDVDYDDQKK